MIIEGTPGADTLIGTAYDDALWGYEGVDTIRANGGNDIIHGDTVWGGTGNDVILPDLLGDDSAHRWFGDNGADEFYILSVQSSPFIQSYRIDGGNGADLIFVDPQTYDGDEARAGTVRVARFTSQDTIDLHMFADLDRTGANHVLNVNDPSVRLSGDNMIVYFKTLAPNWEWLDGPQALVIEGRHSLSCGLVGSGADLVFGE